MDLILAAATRPFAIAIGVMLVLALLETVSAFVGAGLSDGLHSLLPHVDADGAETTFGTVLSFFGIGSVPVMVVILAFLTLFGLAGYIVQALWQAASGGLLPGIVAVIPAAAVAIVGTRTVAHGISRVLPSIETSAVESSSFVGSTATLTLGDARPGAPSEARLRDRYGQTHYFLVEPDVPHAVLAFGATVLIVGQRNNIFLAIPAPSAALLDPERPAGP